MTTTVVNAGTATYTVYLGRAVPRRRLAPSKWANPSRSTPGTGSAPRGVRTLELSGQCR